MSYIEILDPEVGPEADVTQSVVRRLRDNPLAMFEGDSPHQFQAGSLGEKVIDNGRIVDLSITAGKIAPGAIGKANVEEDAINQARLRIGMAFQGVNLGLGSSDNVELSGAGQYAFFPRVVGGSCNASPARDADNEDFSVVVGIERTDTASDPEIYYEARANYIQASPPYDLGDGEIPQFIYAAVNTDGSIHCLSVSDDPPWRDFRTQLTPHLKFDGRSFRFLDHEQKQFLEIDTAYKNTDMPLKPHPFGVTKSARGKTIVLIDPVSDFAHEVAFEKRMDGLREPMKQIKIDNVTLNRKVPQGVIPVKGRWR